MPDNTIKPINFFICSICVIGLILITCVPLIAQEKAYLKNEKVLLSSAEELTGAIFDHAVINVDVSRESGKLPFLYRPGMFLNNQPVGYRMKKFFQDQKPGLIELSHEHSEELHHANSYDEFFQKLPVSKLTQWIKQINNKGGKVLIRLMPVPNWLRKRGIPNGSWYPPRDYDQWASFVEGLADFYNNKLGIDVMYAVWDEPDSFWYGSEEEYFKLYKYSVLGVKRANRKARIGGPAVAGWDSVKGKDDKRRPERKPMLYNFIKYCSQNNIRELGYKSLPLELVIWHAFNQDPFAYYAYKMPVQKVRKWLKEFGYGNETELVMGSWTAWFEPGNYETSRDRDTEVMASYAVTNLIALEEAGFDHQVFFGLFEDWQRGYDPKKESYLLDTYGKSSFFGGYGIFTTDNIIKPVFNAFKAVSMMEGNKLDVQVQDPFITAIAAIREKKIMLLVSNFIPYGSIYSNWLSNFKENMEARLYEQGGYSPEKLVKIRKDILETKMSREQRKLIEKGDIYSLPIPERLKNIIKKTRKIMVLYEKGSKKRKRSSLNASIAFNNLPKNTKLKYERYLIDSEHSNGYTARKQIQAAFKKTEEELDRMVRKELLKNGYEENLLESLDSMSSDEREIWLDKISPEKNRFITVELPGIVSGFLFKKIDSINNRPNIQLQRVEDNIININKSASFKVDLKITPYSVNLIVISLN